MILVLLCIVDQTYILGSPACRHARKVEGTWYLYVTYILHKVFFLKIPKLGQKISIIS